MRNKTAERQQAQPLQASQPPRPTLSSQPEQERPPPPSAAPTPREGQRDDRAEPEESHGHFHGSSRTLSMAEQLDSKLETMRRRKEMGMVETPDISDDETEEDPWTREANRLAKRAQANLAGVPASQTEAYRNRHNAVLDSTELSLSKLVSRVLRLEKLGKLALSSLNAVRAEQADKDETDRHMEVGEERDNQVKTILRSLEKFEAVCAMIHTATSAKGCEPLVKQRREDCANLLGPVGEILGLTKLRALALTSRVERLDAKIANATEGLKGAATNEDGTLYAFEPMSIEDAIGRFITFFDFGSDGGTTLCKPCVSMLEQIRALTAADASTYEEVSGGGAPAISALEARTIERQQTIGRVLELLGNGERHIHTFLRVSLKHFQAERDRVIGTSEKAAALDMLLSEKLATLEKLPEAEKDARK